MRRFLLPALVAGAIQVTSMPAMAADDCDPNVEDCPIAVALPEAPTIALIAVGLALAAGVRRRKD